MGWGAKAKRVVAFVEAATEFKSVALNALFWVYFPEPSNQCGTLAIGAFYSERFAGAS